MISYLGGVGRRNGRRRRKKEEISEYDLMVWHGMKSSRHAFMYSFCNRLSPSTLSGGGGGQGGGGGGGGIKGEEEEQE